MCQVLYFRVEMQNRPQIAPLVWSAPHSTIMVNDPKSAGIIGADRRVIVMLRGRAFRIFQLTNKLFHLFRRLSLKFSLKVTTRTAEFFP